jgi:hypothetical protein
MLLILMKRRGREFISWQLGVRLGLDTWRRYCGVMNEVGSFRWVYCDLRSGERNKVPGLEEL